MALDSRLPRPPAALAPASSRWQLLVDSTEGRMLLVGLAMCLGLALAVGVGLLVAPEVTTTVATVLGLSLVIGIAAGISYGFAAGLGWSEMVVCNVVVESLQVLVVYPLFLLAWHHLVDFGPAAPLLDRLRQAAQARQDSVRRWGIAGLFVFVFIPFWMTGPVVGAIIGFLIGLGSAVNLAIVLSASALGVVVYATFLEHLNAWATAVHPYAVFGTVLALVVLAALLRQRRRGAAPPSARAPDEPGA